MNPHRALVPGRKTLGAAVLIAVCEEPGELRPGDIGDDIGASRTVVDKAVRRLEAGGLLVSDGGLLSPTPTGRAWFVRLADELRRSA